MGRLLRDDDAMQMLKTALRSLPVDAKAIADHVTALAMDAIRATQTDEDLRRLSGEAERIRKKKEAMLDSYFSGAITNAEMQSMSRKYDTQHQALLLRRQEADRCRQENETLQGLIHADLSGILRGEVENEVFCKNILERITVFQDRHMELRLELLPQVFRFTD